MKAAVSPIKHAGCVLNVGCVQVDLLAPWYGAQYIPLSYTKITQSMLHMESYNLHILMDRPIDIYFIMEPKHGFNQYSITLWVWINMLQPASLAYQSRCLKIGLGGLGWPMAQWPSAEASKNSLSVALMAWQVIHLSFQHQSSSITTITHYASHFSLKQYSSTTSIVLIYLANCGNSYDFRHFSLESTV